MKTEHRRATDGRAAGVSLGNLTASDPRYSRDPDGALAPIVGCPFYNDPISGNLLVLGYDAAQAALVDRATSRDPMRKFGRVSKAQEMSIMQLDDPEHGRVRRALLTTLSARTKRFTPTVRCLVGRRIEALADDTPFDAVRDYAQPIAADVMASLYGVNEGQREDLKRWMVDLSLAFELGQNDEQAKRHETAVRSLNAFLRGAAAARRAKPSDNWISDIVHGSDLSDVEIAHTLRMTVLASVLPLCAAISGTLHLLVASPLEMEKVRRDPQLCADAVEEALRIDPPGEAVSRGSFQGVDIAGLQVGSFRQIEVMVRSANHDPTAFENPDKFVVDAERTKPHLSFGSGYRMCLGAGFARLVVGVAVEALIKRFEALAPAVPGERPRWRPLPILRVLETLPLVGSNRPTS